MPSKSELSYISLGNATNERATTNRPFRASLYAGTLCVRQTQKQTRTEIVTLEIHSHQQFILQTVTADGHTQLARGCLAVAGNELKIDGVDQTGKPIVGLGRLKNACSTLQITFRHFQGGEAHGILHR